MKKKIKISIENIIPIIAFAAIVIYFEIASSGKMLKVDNLLNILNQTMVVIVAGTGVMFVVAQGSIDLSVGVNLALSGVLAMQVVRATGYDSLLIPMTLAIGIMIGLFNGFIVSKCKVPSFMVTLSLLVGLRGLVNYIQSIFSIAVLPASLKILNNNQVKIPVFLIIVALMVYIFEYTKIGKFSRAIGENETTAKFTGIPIVRMKILVFALSGLMAGVSSIFSMESLGGTSTTMGVFFEMNVMMAIYLGGVLVTGGSSAKMYKLVLGAFTITLIGNGLALIGKSSSQISQLVQGLILLVILFATVFSHDRIGRKPLAENRVSKAVSDKCCSDDKMPL